MSTFHNPKSPAYFSLLPESPNWLVENNDLVDKIKECLNLKSDLHSMCVNGKYDFRFFRYKPNNLFIKLVSNDIVDSQLNGNKISSWLSDRNIKTNRIRQGFPVPFDDVSSLIGYSYIDGSFSNRSTQQINKIGQQVARLHEVMKTLPWANLVAKRGHKKQKIVHHQIQQILENIQSYFSSSQKYDRDLLRNIDTGILYKHPQPIHGDLNFGNILFDRNGQPVFLDFEDAGSAWLNPHVDICFVIERYCFDLNPLKTEEKICSFLDGYFEGSRTHFKLNFINIHGTLLAMSLRAIALLSRSKELNPRESYLEKEYLKFIELIKKANHIKPMLDRVSNKYNQYDS